ncbi:gasdermin-C-like isoform X2 [Equus przewalskii]|uniref:Gasdermin-C-like isoform X2 n=1 Tax=Equus przewalskii TaxID=9798 RepID=A0ABM4QC76_EQUPR
MPSMFERTSKNITKEIGDKDLRPAKNLLSATRIHQFSLLLKRKTHSQFWEQPEVPIEVSLMDILEPSSSVPETVKTGQFHITDTAVKKWKARVSVNAGVEAGLLPEAAEFYGSSLQYQIVTIPFHTWTDLQKRKLLDPEPLFLKQCRKTAVNLYVVTEIVELLNSPVLYETRSENILGKFSFTWNMFVKGEGAGERLKVREKELTLQKGMVMAYKRKQLVFKENGWDIYHISDDDKQKTFPEDIKFRIMRSAYTEEIPSVLPIGRIEKRFGQEFKHLQEEVSQQMEALAQLTKGVQDALFHNIPAMLGDRGALQELMDMLEQEPLGHLSGPGGTILNELRKDSSYPPVNPKYPILYLLEAILVLSDIQHDLLAQSKEKRILLHQRELVRSILEPNLSYPWNIPFTIKPELLAPLQGEGLAITYGLLEECGLKMQLDSPRSTWDLEAKKPLSALYGILSMLQQLAEA